MIKGIAALYVAGCALFACSHARAEEQFAHQGQVTVGVERLFGVVHTIESSPGNSTRTYTGVNLAGDRFGGLMSGYTFPRLGADYFALDGLSLGAGLGFFAAHQSGTAYGFLVAPRVGYAYMFNDVFGLWPRGGATLTTVHSQSEGGSGDGHLVALTLELPLVVAPMRHVAFSIAPTLDLGLSGGHTEHRAVLGVGLSDQGDSKVTDFGVQAGLLLYF